MKSWRVLDRAIFILLFGVVPCLQLSFFENPSLHPKQLLSLLTVPLMFLGLARQSILVPESQIFWIGTGLLGIAMAMSFAFGPNQVSSWPFWLESLCSLAAYFYFFRHFSVDEHATRLLMRSLLFAAVVNLVFVGYQLMTFRKGWVKASAVMKKSLLKDLVYFVLVGPKGLKIQFRLKHDLNKDVTPEELTAAKIFEINVIDLSEKRQKKSEEAEATSESKNSNNSAIAGSQVVGFGRECRARTDDIHLVRVALYQLS